MSCEHCGKWIAKGEDFVIVGKYPAEWKALLSRGTLPENFGRIYHKACYSELLKEEELKRKGRNKS